MPTAAVLIGFVMFSFFLEAQRTKNNSIVDIAWGLGFVGVVLKFWAAEPWIFSPKLLITAMIIIWGTRLSIYIGKRNKGKPEDFRYQNFRKKWGKYPILGAFLQVFVLQGFIMWWVLMPVYVIFAGSNVWFSDWKIAVQILGIILFIIGFLFEAIGDHQMRKFKSLPQNKGKIIQSGLWKYTRHPNYFGECVLWWGIALFAFPFPNGWLALLAPILMTFLLTKVSGVPMLEEKYKGNPEFKAYAAKTPAFFPKFW